MNNAAISVLIPLHVSNNLSSDSAPKFCMSGYFVFLQKEKDLPKTHPIDARKIVDRLDQSILEEEACVNNLFSEIQMLREGRFMNSEQIYRR